MERPSYHALKRELEELRAENRTLRSENAALRRENSALKNRIADLQAALEAAERKGKRQAAPFSKGAPKQNPKKPGRKPGRRYGTKAHRRPPAPEQIDEFYEAVLPDACPHCGGAVEHEKTVPQYQAEIPTRPIYRQFNVQIGHCRACGHRVQGKHSLQTSDALGAAASQLGPNAQAAAVFLNKYCGLSHGKISRLFSQLFGIELSRGGSAQVILRAGRRCQDTYEQIRSSVHRSPWVVGDETGWKLGGQSGWLHVLVGPEATCYCLARSRGGEVAAGVLGWDWPGIFIHDGLSSYDRFSKAKHQQCLQHLLKRARQMLAVAQGGAVHFPRQIITLFEQALSLRDLHQAGRISSDELAEQALGLACHLEQLTSRKKQNEANERLRKHLKNHLWHWFWFLLEPGLDATNWRAEQAVRLGVINRKVWGGSRTDPGRSAQEVLMSVIATCFRQHLSPIQFIRQLICGWTPQLIPP